MIFSTPSGPWFTEKVIPRAWNERSAARWRRSTSSADSVASCRARAA
jgi:hypothetical protein